jgi:hypothetical protein
MTGLGAKRTVAVSKLCPTWLPKVIARAATVTSDMAQILITARTTSNLNRRSDGVVSKTQCGPAEEFTNCATIGSIFEPFGHATYPLFRAVRPGLAGR